MAPPTIAVPSDARQAAVWFETTSVYGCHACDSNYGNNYMFDAMLAAAVDRQRHDAAHARHRRDSAAAAR